MSRGVVLQVPEQRWHCPSCGLQDVTREARPHTRMHECARLGLTVPMLPDGLRGEHRPVERQDWIGTDHVQYDRVNGRPIMSVQTITDRGEDCTIYAPTARNKE